MVDNDYFAFKSTSGSSSGGGGDNPILWLLATIVILSAMGKLLR